MSTPSKASKIVMAIAIPATLAAYGIAIAAFAIPTQMSLVGMSWASASKEGKILKSQNAYPEKKMGAASETFSDALKKVKEADRK